MAQASSYPTSDLSLEDLQITRFANVSGESSSHSQVVSNLESSIRFKQH
jgi:hypothetical protein